MKNYVIKKEKNTEGIKLISEKNVSIVLLKVKKTMQTRITYLKNLPNLNLKCIVVKCLLNVFLRNLLV